MIWYVMAFLVHMVQRLRSTDESKLTFGATDIYCGPYTLAGTILEEKNNAYIMLHLPTYISKWL